MLNIVRLLSFVALLASACSLPEPVRSRDRLVGTYRMAHLHAQEILELRADGSLVQSLHASSGRTTTTRTNWEFDGGHVTLGRDWVEYKDNMELHPGGVVTAPY